MPNTNIVQLQQVVQTAETVWDVVAALLTAVMAFFVIRSIIRMLQITYFGGWEDSEGWTHTTYDSVEKNFWRF